MLKQFISKVIRNKVFYPFWKRLNILSQYGMNFGVASGYADYSGELYIMKKLKKELENGVIFDIGAHVGDWSSSLINEYSDLNYILYMFEPSVKTYNKLIENIDESKNKKCHNIGFGDKEEVLTIHYDSVDQGNASILSKNTKYSEEVNITTIDSFCIQNDIKCVDFIKMDVQGYEYNILEGASDFLASGKIKFIQFEFDEPNIENRMFFRDFWNLLNDKYYIYHSLFNGLIQIKDYDYTLENYRCMNYLAIKKDIKIKL